MTNQLCLKRQKYSYKLFILITTALLSACADEKKIEPAAPAPVPREYELSWEKEIQSRRDKLSQEVKELSVAQFANLPKVPVLVVDGPAELDHIEIQKFKFLNTNETRGRGGVDDDQNGFVDDFFGWNMISQNNQFMPRFLRDGFEKHRYRIKELFSLYSGSIKGDAGAKKALSNHPDRESLPGLVEYSHGSHVSGIVALNSLGVAQISSMNVSVSESYSLNEFSAQLMSKQIIVPYEIAGLSRPLISDQSIHLQLRTFSSAPDEPIPASPFDDEVANQKLLQDIQNKYSTEGATLQTYIRSHGFQVVNLSMGIDKLNVQNSLERTWRMDRQLRQINPDIPRTTIQEQYFRNIASALFDGHLSSWRTLASNNPQVMFVFAAGNSGNPNYPTQGNIDSSDPISPAVLGGELSNVMTVAAVDASNKWANFSSFGPQNVSLAAYGVAVDSLGPANLQLAMSGTSMAAPAVSGVIAFLKSLHPTLSPSDIRALLERTVNTSAELQSRVKTSGSMNWIKAARDVNAMRNIQIESVR